MCIYVSIIFLEAVSQQIFLKDKKYTQKQSHISQRQEIQGHSQNLKEVPQIFMEVLNIDVVPANEVIQRNQHRKERKK